MHLSVYVFICTYMYVYVYMYMYLFVYIDMYVYVRIYTDMYGYMDTRSSQICSRSGFVHQDAGLEQPQFRA